MNSTPRASPHHENGKLTRVLVSSKLLRKTNSEGRAEPINSMTILHHDESEYEEERFFGRGRVVFFPAGIPADLLNQALIHYRTHSADEVRKLLVLESQKRDILQAIIHPKVGIADLNDQGS